MTRPLESHVRRLRNFVYGQTISEDEWRNCRDSWMRPTEVKWLEEQERKMRKK